MRSIGRSSRERGDIGRAEDNAESLEDKIHDLENKFEQDLCKMEDKIRIDNLLFERVQILARKSEV